MNHLLSLYYIFICQQTSRLISLSSIVNRVQTDTNDQVCLHSHGAPLRQGQFPGSLVRKQCSGQFSVNLTQGRVIRKEQSSTEENSQQTGLWGSLGCLFLIDDLCGRAQIILGGAILGLVVLGTIRNQVEQMETKLVIRTLPCLLWQLLLPSS